jgi:hypothetical protein
MRQSVQVAYLVRMAKFREFKVSRMMEAVSMSITTCALIDLFIKILTQMIYYYCVGNKRRWRSPRWLCSHLQVTILPTLKSLLNAPYNPMWNVAKAWALPSLVDEIHVKIPLFLFDHGLAFHALVPPQRPEV